MQEVSEPAGRRPAQQLAGVDLRRPKGYAAPPPSAAAAAEGDPCPRCESRDTKFCYYNNYNTAQPRHFCKGCRRYWTKGGTLRNVPVGGGTRKKPSSSSSSSSSSSPSSYAAAAKPKGPYKKKRRVAPAEPSAPAPVASPAAVVSAKTTPTTATADSAKTTTTTTATTPTTDAASEITTELVVPAAAEDDSLTHLLQPDADAVALGLGLSDFPCSGKSALLEPDSFEWPASFDLGACWATAGGFADPDPALFLNLP